jgi:ABC-type nitrate/sulfonate/bicarbonate transport system permease component
MVGLSWHLFRATRPIVEFLRPIPSVGLVPLAILLFGAGLSSKVFLAAITAFWQLFILTMYGARDLEPLHGETARAYQIGRVRRMARVTFPGAMPYIATGVRIASTVALLLTITAELLIGSPGVGQEIEIARQSANIEAMYAMIFTAGLLGLVLNLIFSQTERYFLRWHPSQRRLG